MSGIFGRCIFLLSIVPVAGGCSAGRGGYVFYVSPGGDDAGAGTRASEPFASILRAREAVRELKGKSSPDKPVTVYLRGGVYELDEPVVFRPEDSGTESCPVTYAAWPGEKPVISCGRRITGWQKGPGELWQAHLPEVAAGEWNFRRFFVNGNERPRSRIPNEGFFRVAGFPDGGKEVKFGTPAQRFEYAPGKIDPGWSNLEDGVVVAFHYWIDEHLPIKAVDEENRIVTFRTKSGMRFTDSTGERGARYIVENIEEGVNEPGEWCLNSKSGLLSYWPMAGENPNECECVAPAGTAFVLLQGEPESNRFVEHLKFENLTFAYSHYDLAEGERNSIQAAYGVDGAITMKGARRCEFDHCSVKAAGGYAFELQEGCTYNRFTNNRIELSGAGGFKVTGGGGNEHPLLRTGFNVIADNEICGFGEVFKSATGILLMHTEGNKIVHNHIHDGWYSGVSVGWSWGYQRSVSRDNNIDFNHIHDIGKGLLSDMGGIYTLGVSYGTTIRNNLIHGVDAFEYGGWGIYNDEGSTGILIENNIVYDTKFSNYHMHYGKEVTIRNNIFAGGRIDQIARTRREAHQSFFFENNIVYWTQGRLLSGDWGDTMGEAGKAAKSFVMDFNLYCNPNLNSGELDFAGADLEAWRERGHDEHSVFADPRFVDAENRDYRLKCDSPAFGLGFRPIDMSKVGPRNAVGPAACE